MPPTMARLMHCFGGPELVDTFEVFADCVDLLVVAAGVFVVVFCVLVGELSTDGGKYI